MAIVTRFAPSPTGFLHIGGARTALFNYLYSKATGGQYLLRIEDTDFKRSTPEAILAILNGLEWLGIKHDGKEVYQSKNVNRHREVAFELLQKGEAYKCYSTAAELDELRKKAEAEGKAFKYPRIWRDNVEDKDIPYSIRIKAPTMGEIKIHDLIRGDVAYPASDLDDMVLLRSDGTPTYMLAVVVDDYDMGVTHIIRGDDHLTNTFRQKVIYDCMGWKMPVVAHVPLIHGADGAKLSKRHGALGVEAYRDLGYLPEAINNYLMSLGWFWGDEDVISIEDAIKKFDIKNVGKSPSRFDFAKLNHINGIYLRKKSSVELRELAKPFLEKLYGAHIDLDVVTKLAPAIAERSSTLEEFASNCAFIPSRITPYTEKAAKMLEQCKPYLPELIANIANISDWKEETIKKTLDDFATHKNIKAGQYLPALRASICGTMESPSLIAIIYALGKDEVLKRMENL